MLIVFAVFRMFYKISSLGFSMVLRVQLSSRFGVEDATKQGAGW